MKAREPEKRREAHVIALNTSRRKAATPVEPAKPAHIFDRTDVLAALGQHRVPEVLAYSLAGNAANSGYGDPVRALAAALEKQMTALPINYVRANAILLKGLCGAGKTTVACKITAQAHLTRRIVKVLASDPMAAPLRKLTMQIEVPVAAAKSVQSVANAVARAHEDRSLVVIDSQGFNPRKAKARAAFAALGQIGRVETIGVLSALADAVETQEIIAALGVDRLIVTGLDLARRLGAVTVAATCGTPLAHVARSPFAGDGLEPLTALALAQTLLGVRPNLQ